MLRLILTLRCHPLMFTPIAASASASTATRHKPRSKRRVCTDPTPVASGRGSLAKAYATAAVSPMGHGADEGDAACLA